MNEKKITVEFNMKFRELTEHNQKYIMAIQQALMFAQMTHMKVEEGLDVEKIVSINHIS